MIITTPAMNFPCPSVTPEAVRNSVSMFSLITAARAGIIYRNSDSEAARQPAGVGLPKDTVPISNDKHNAFTSFLFITPPRPESSRFQMVSYFEFLLCGPLRTLR